MVGPTEHPARVDNGNEECENSESEFCVFLKALTIKGFKSFAEPAVLELEPGITVVVGPNGSGKSNVVDAMAWVLGAQAPTAVRSQKMDDVIFAGTAAKKALGRAEVSLTIDNADKVLPIEFNEVTIARTLFRSGDSDYAINGVSCRLLDIQELLSDSGIGRQQHIIVSQGRIDDVLNARPEDRRAIVEEAAGVLKYRKRRERAERRLAATGDNLSRLQDLLREVKRQIRPLEKQADAARRHGSVVAQLNDLKIHLAGRELKALTGQLSTSARLRVEYDDREAQLSTLLSTLDADVLQGEAELSALGTSDIGEVLSRAKSTAERIRGQANVMAERKLRLEGELQAAVDDGLVSSLEAESARLTAELTEASAEIDLLQPDFADLMESEKRLVNEQLTFDTDWGDTLAPGSGRAAEVRAQINALGLSTERDEQELGHLGKRIEALDTRKERAAQAKAQAEEQRRHNESILPDLRTKLGQCKDTVAGLDIRQSAVAEERRQAENEAGRWQARAEALSQALDEARIKAGSEALANNAGVLGTLLDLIDVDPGYELAVEAALGDALIAVVVEGNDNAEAALRSLDDQGLAGAVLSVGGPVPPPTTGSSQQLGPEADQIRSYVRPLRPDIGPVLDTLLADAVLLDSSWQQSVDRLVANPSTTFVTAQGDRFGPRGWHLRAGGTGATATALEEARAQETATQNVVQQVVSELATIGSQLADATAEFDRVSDEVVQCETVLERSGVVLDRATTELTELEADREQLVGQRQTLFLRKQKDADEMRELSTELPAAENEEREYLSRAEALNESRTTLDERSRAVASRRTELEVRIGAIEERRELLRSRQSATEARLERLVNEREKARVRRERIEHGLGVVEELSSSLQEKKIVVADWIEVLEIEQKAQSEQAKLVSDILSEKRGNRLAAEKETVELRERRSRLEVNEAEHRIKLEALTEALRRELDTDPEFAMSAPQPEFEGSATPENKVRELERELKIMGAINPLALEEFEELKERFDFLETQVSDVKTARRDLQKLIQSIDQEIVGVFSSAFADLATNFTQLFGTLFPGGKGGLKLTNPNDILNCGIEIEAKPSGKNVKKLSLLSGGERSLVALAFLFGVFRSRPSPFYVMDEVEAALDDVNLSRFLALVEEFRKEAQLIIVSHQKRTMESADVLYGVSMKPGGSSRVLTEKVQERKVARAPAFGAKPTVKDDNQTIELDQLDGAETTADPQISEGLDASEEPVEHLTED